MKGPRAKGTQYGMWHGECKSLGKGVSHFVERPAVQLFGGRSDDRGDPVCLWAFWHTPGPLRRASEQSPRQTAVHQQRTHPISLQKGFGRACDHRGSRPPAFAPGHAPAIAVDNHHPGQSESDSLGLSCDHRGSRPPAFDPRHAPAIAVDNHHPRQSESDSLGLLVVDWTTARVPYRQGRVPGAARNPCGFAPKGGIHQARPKLFLKASANISPANADQSRLRTNKWPAAQARRALVRGHGGP